MRIDGWVEGLAMCDGNCSPGLQHSFCVGGINGELEFIYSSLVGSRIFEESEHCIRCNFRFCKRELTLTLFKRYIG